MKKAIIIILLLLYYNIGTAQTPNLVITQGKAQVQWYPERESLTEAKERALQAAKIDALQAAFGTVVSQGNSFYIENKKTGDKVKTNSTFKMIGNTAVKGEIIEILKEDYDKTERKERINRKKVKITYISCKLKIKAKEISETDIAIESFTLNSHKIVKPVTSFKDGDNLFLYFRSPVNGFLSVYLDDGTNAQCLLPYRNMPSGMEDAMPIKADKEYMFFSDFMEHNYFEDDFFKEDTYVLVVSDVVEINNIYVIFSKDKLNKPILNKDEQSNIITERQNYELPRIINSNDFKKWIIQIKQIRNDLKVKKIQIDIKK